MIKFLKALFFPKDDEVIYEDDVKITLNRREGTMVIDTTRDLTPEELQDYMKRFL